ncbi:MAG: glycosyl transferase [Phycicoccus sp.]|nr:glycosyl transferase [Phycicoccus sp.]NMM32884.1 glycosyl transferase [Phycicoccus sp.]
MDEVTGSAGVGGSALKLAIVGPSRSGKGAVAGHTKALVHHLAQAGHDVTLVSWSHPFPQKSASEARAVPGAPDIPAFPRTVRALSWARPDTWVRTGLRLRGFDAIIVVPATPIEVPAHLVMLRAAGVGPGTARPSDSGPPRSIVIAHDELPQQSRAGDSALVRSLFERVDAVMVHSHEQARRAHDLHAVRVSVANPGEAETEAEPVRQQQQVETSDLSSPWAHYVGAMEALASPHWQAAEQDPPESTPVPRFNPSFRTRLSAPARRMAQRRRPVLALTRLDLPEWVRSSDVLGDGADADDARAWARVFGLPRCADPVAAWAALGALAAIVRLGDDGHRSAVILDGSGVHSPLARWARAIGFAPVELVFPDIAASAAGLDVDAASMDVITRLHPNGCDSEDVDEVLSEASSALRSGGLISLTLPLGPASADGGVGPADVRALLARAHALGFVLVGDLDGDIATLMRAASEGSQGSDAAYALVRLTFRRL